MELTRREFILLLSLPFLKGCGGASQLVRDQLPQPDVQLEESQETVSKAIDVVRSFLDNPRRQPIRVGVSEGQNLVFQIVHPNSNSRSLANYPYLKITSEKIERGQMVVSSANFLWGIDPQNLLSIVIKDDTGKEIARQSIPIKSREKNEVNWLKAGITAAIVGLIAWIGAGIGRLILAAVGFIAFNLMIIGLLVAAGYLVVEILRRLGVELSLQGFKELLNKSVEFFKNLLNEMADSLNR
ncbi:MAG: hypothetical protein NZ822_01050 [Patescibacteria group bacterium]|nr:hypothetical protein [Patescibacteria group bacterium]